MRNLLENRFDSSPRMRRHSWDLFKVQSAKFEKLPSYKEAKRTKKIFWIISHQLLK